MRKGLRSTPLVLALLMLVTLAQATVKPVGAQPAPASPPLVTLPLAGTTSGNGTFSGTLAISSVGSDGSGGVFVEGLVTGTVTRANKTPLGTIVSVPVRLPLQGNWPRGLAQQAPGDSIVLAATCGVLHLEIGAVNLNALGVVVATSPIALDVSGDTAGPLGALVCSILNLVGGLAGLVNLLTSLLGALGGALGGAVPTV